MPPDIREPADEGHCGDVAKQIARDNPGRVVKLGDRKLEVEHYFGQHRNHDRLVVRSHEHPGEYRRQRCIRPSP